MKMLLRTGALWPVVALMVLYAMVFGSSGAEGAITILNQSTSHFTVTVISPCLQYKVLYKKEPFVSVEEYVNVQGCHKNFAEFTLPATRKSITVDIEDGSYVVIDDSPSAMATISAYLIDTSSHSVLSSLFYL